MLEQRNTRQKKIILDALKNSDHPTATELFEDIAQENPTISRATVFRVLSQFAESGKVNKITLSENSARYDAATHPHAHAQCVCCGKVFDVNSDDIVDILAKRYVGNFTIYSAKIDFTGVCIECMMKKRQN